MANANSEFGDAPACDLTCDLVNIALQESTGLHRDLMAETRANANMTHALVRNQAAILNTKQSPIEAAAVEVLLGGTAGT